MHFVKKLLSYILYNPCSLADKGVRENARFNRKQREAAKEFETRESLLLSHPQEVKRLSDLIVLEQRVNTFILCKVVYYSLCNMRAIFKANSPKSTKSMKNLITRWRFQQNCYSSTCTAKSPFTVNCGLIMALTGYSGVCY